MTQRVRCKCVGFVFVFEFIFVTIKFKAFINITSSLLKVKVTCSVSSKFLAVVLENVSPLWI